MATGHPPQDQLWDPAAELSGLARQSSHQSWEPLTIFLTTSFLASIRQTLLLRPTPETLPKHINNPISSSQP